VRPGKSGLTLELVRGGAVAGEVVRVDGTPVTSFNLALVDVSSSDRAGWAMDSADFDDDSRSKGAPSRRDVADGRGAFRIGAVRAGTYHIIVKAQTGEAGRLEGVVVRDEQTTGPLRILCGRITLRGRVVEQGSGRPLGGAEVKELRLFEARLDLAGVRTDAGGAFALAGAVPGKTIVLDVNPAGAGHVHGRRAVRVPATGAEADIGTIPVLASKVVAGRGAERAGETGIQAGVSLDGVIVEWIAPGSPADVAGIVRGERVERIDGREVAALGPLAARHLMEGPPGSVVRVTILTAAGERRVVKLRRAVIPDHD
jgi:hypothetical protein